MARLIAKRFDGARVRKRLIAVAVVLPAGGTRGRDGNSRDRDLEPPDGSQQTRAVSKAFPHLSEVNDVQLVPGTERPRFQGLSNGRTWDRTRDLPRVKRALSR